MHFIANPSTFIPGYVCDIKSTEFPVIHIDNIFMIKMSGRNIHPFVIHTNSVTSFLPPSRFLALHAMHEFFFCKIAGL